MPCRGKFLSLKDLENPTELEFAYAGEQFTKQFSENMEKGVGFQLQGNHTVYPKQDSSDWIAVVGMACRFPQANSVDEYWNILNSGKCTSTSPPAHRILLTNMNKDIKANFLTCPIDKFDANFFQISPKEATMVDPQCRLLLEVSWEAFEDAGINPSDLRNTKTGVFYGSWLQDYRDALNSISNSDFIRKYYGNGFACTAAKLSYFYGFTGPNMSMESGCASSMVALDLAVKSLQRWECPVALACGANLILDLQKQTKIWSEEGKSKVFDAGADGYGRAEGVATLLLKRYSDAVRDKDNIHLIIRGSAVCQEGLTTSFGTPTVESQCWSMKMALQSAKQDPTQVDYVEAHATGTQVGDRVEAEAIVKAYSAGMREQPLIIGSGKASIGHTESVSGLAGIIKVIMAIKHSTIPKQINLTEVNSAVNFSPIPGEIPFKSMPWFGKHDRPRIAGVSSFGISGTCVHMIVQEAPMKKDNKAISLINEAGSPQPEILALSGKSEEALKQLKRDFQEYLMTTEESFQNIIYTANVCRPHHQYRCVAEARSLQDLATKLSANDLISSASFLETQKSSKKICFTFPGKIGKFDKTPFYNLYQTVPYFKHVIDKCDGSHQKVLGAHCSLVSILMTEDEDLEMSPSNDKIFPALMFTCQYALAMLWIHWGISPDSVMGYCGAELTAMLICGALELEDLYRIVAALPHQLFVSQTNSALKLMAINNSRDFVEQLIQPFHGQHPNLWIDVTAANTRNQTVVAGLPQAIQKFQQICDFEGIKSKILNFESYAHSRAVEPFLLDKKEIFNQIKFHPMKIPFVSSATGKTVTDSEMNGEHIFKIFRNCINFTQACTSAMEENLGTVFIEMGCNDALTKFTIENMDRNVNVTCIPTFSHLKYSGLWTAVGQVYALGGNFEWKKMYNSKTCSSIKKVKLPNYPFQRKSFWYHFGVKKPNISLSGVAYQESTAQSLHPLLGTPLAAPAGHNEVIAFEDFWLNDEHAETTRFFHDHIIGDTVILPAAAFIEMMLAALKHHKKDSKDFTPVLHNLRIHVALLLDSSKPVKVQVVLDTKSTTVSVFSAFTNCPWTLNASADYSCTHGNFTLAKSFDLAKFFENVETKKSESTTSEFYSTAKNVGLNFGPSFKSLKETYSNRDGDTLFEVEIDENFHSSSFICHPILMDAMIQSFLLHTRGTLNQLFVPVQIGKFEVLNRCSEESATSNKKWYVHCKLESSRCELLDHGVHLVAVMENIIYAATSVEAVTRAAEIEINNKKAGPGLSIYDINWEQSHFYPSISITNWKYDAASETARLDEIAQEFEKLNVFTDKEQQLDRAINRLCYLYVAKALVGLGCDMTDVTDGRLGKKDNIQKLGIVPYLERAFNHYLSYLKDDQSIPQIQKIENEISDILNTSPVKDYKAIKTVDACGSKLSGILNGTINPHRILFGENNLANHYYKTNRFANCLAPLQRLFEREVTNRRTDVVTVLEVGAGTGSFSRGAIEFLRNSGVSFEYHYTDISPTLIDKAADFFSKEDKSLIFKCFNVEQDPLRQGIPPDYFDVVVACDVLHATRNLSDTLRHVGMVTKMGGCLLVSETEKPIREADISFGILDGYWLYEDTIREEHCTIGADMWIKLFAENGFGKNPVKILCNNGQKCCVTAKKSFNVLSNVNHISTEKYWIIIHYGEQGLDNFLQYLIINSDRVAILMSGLSGHELGETIAEKIQNCEGTLEGILVWMVGDYSTSMEELPQSKKILEPLLYISKYLINANLKVLPKFHLITPACWDMLKVTASGELNPASALAWGFMRTLRTELPGLSSKTVGIQPDNLLSNDGYRQVLREMWVDDMETEVCYFNGARYVRRLKEVSKTGQNRLYIPAHGDYQIELPRSRLINDLKYAEIPSSNQDLDLGIHDIHVEIRNVALNFRDVVKVLKPDELSNDTSSLGLDFAGVVTQVGSNVTKWKEGDNVFGINIHGECLKNKIKIDQDLVYAVPANMTHKEAATLPVVFLTAWHCIVNVANVKPRDTILIHAASGGVGLMSLQVAKILGAKVICTAGSEKKRSFLRSLGIKHVLNSRTPDFGQQVQNITCGRGVAMVLNCMTGPGFKEASLQACRDGGHFVEISKLGIWTGVEVRALRPNVFYTVVDILTLKPNVVNDIMIKLTSLLVSTLVTPLPYTAFSSSAVVEAFTYLEKAEQIRKVVIDMPRAFCGARAELLFDSRSTYLITGGKGTIGFAVCKWMVSQGAKYIVLVGRSEANEKTKQAIKDLERGHGSVIICKELDVSDFTEVEQLIHNDIVTNLPPLKGIQHCSGVLADKSITQQTWEDFDMVLKPKVNGAWNLHSITKNIPLDHFVLYSSAIATFGRAGQSNYVSGSLYMDSLAEFRQSMHLPALSVNWGQWNAGLASDKIVEGFQKFSIEEGISTLEYLMKNHRQGLVLAGHFNFSSALKLMPFHKITLAEYVLELPNDDKQSSPNDENVSPVNCVILRDRFAELDNFNDKMILIKKFIVGELCQVLGTAENEISDNVEFRTMGMDSLMSIEFENKIYANICIENNGGRDFINLELNSTVSKLTTLIMSILEKTSLETGYPD